MSIKKRGNSWQIDYTDITGKRVRKSGFKTKAEADIALTEAKANKNKGLSNVIDKNITIQEACIYFIERYAKLHCKEKTYDEYYRIVNKEIIPYLKNAKLAKLSKIDVENFICYLIDTKNLSTATINKYKTLLGSIIEREIENGAIFQNVVNKVKNLKNNSKQARALTKEEIEKLLNSCKLVNPYFYPMLFTALNTGMRRGELIALMWNNVDFDKNLIYVIYSSYKGKLVTPKSKTSYRGIRISKALKKVLIEQKLKTGNGEFVFPNSKGGIFIGDNVSKRLFAPVVKACNIGHIKFHDLRHTFGSQLLENGATQKYVQTQMGHSSSRITLDIYNHLLPDSYQKADEIMDNLYLAS